MTEQLADKNPCNDCKADRQMGNPNRWQCECDRCDKPNDWKNDCIKKLAEYETADEEGRLVVIPYKIGMTLFLPRRGEVLPFKVVGTRIIQTEQKLTWFISGITSIINSLALIQLLNTLNVNFTKQEKKPRKH